MKPIQPSASDPETAMQELDDWSTIVTIRSFLVIFWIQDRWAELRRGVRSAGAMTLAVLCAMAALVMGVALIVVYLVRQVGTRCCAALINRNNGAAQQHGPTQGNQ